ncbi:MAG: hypothetical protein E4G94_06965 [ANME-2 cluster archaeon]|nr:MAG: hypothetical protein E4G94_06965 [ANME-2 cluster archaeon]
MNNPSPLAAGLDLAGFEPSTITLIEGPSRFVPDLLLHLSAYIAGRRGRDVVFVDGDNSFNPYNLQRIAKVQQTDARTVMKKTHVARAFTEYQMNDLLTQQLLPAVNKWEPGMLAVAYLPHLFGESNAKKLLEQSVENIKEITLTHCLTTLITSHGGTWWGARLVEDCADRVVRVIQRRKIVKIMDEQNVIEFAPIPAGQMQLDAYPGAV